MPWDGIFLIVRLVKWNTLMGYSHKFLIMSSTKCSNMLNRVANAGLISMAMVVGIHVCGGAKTYSSLWWWNECTHYGVFLVGVPFFFVCSGYFLARHSGEIGWWRIACMSRVRSILIPYLIWSVIAAMMAPLMCLGANVLHSRLFFSGICGALPGDWSLAFGFDVFHWPAYVPLWYLRSLMLFVFISPLIIFSVRKYGLKALGGVYILWMIFCFSHGHPRIEGFVGEFLSIEGWLWFSLGCWIALNRDRSQSFGVWIYEKRWYCLLFGLVLLLINACFVGSWGYRVKILVHRSF